MSLSHEAIKDIEIEYKCVLLQHMLQIRHIASLLQLHRMDGVHMGNALLESNIT